ncbi:amidohydrolase [Puteibacter caeruleilacunae]|nr:amidohydrolase [Puteibacter caeruleilacunae]
MRSSRKRLISKQKIKSQRISKRLQRQKRNKMRKLSAHYIFSGKEKPLKNGILVLDDDGKVVELIDRQGSNKEVSGLEFHPGIITPGFINTHCHLELSYLKNGISRGNGLAAFLGEVKQQWSDDAELIQSAARKADKLMQRNGIVAVGDVTNTVNALEVKRKSLLKYHTFCEAFGILKERAERAFSKALDIREAYIQHGLKATIIPHSLYAVSDELLEMIDKVQEDTCSLHYMESREEIEVMSTGEGPLRRHYENTIGLELSGWQHPGISHAHRLNKWIGVDKKLLLVHNTFMNDNALNELKKDRSTDNTWLTLCPKSNIHIEQQLPDIPLLMRSGFPLCLGTDSFASNDGLSILDEMRLIQQQYPETALVDMITWATVNGAEALGFEEQGSFEPGKRPGVNLISGANLKELKLTSNSRVNVLA